MVARPASIVYHKKGYVNRRRWAKGKLLAEGGAVQVVRRGGRVARVDEDIDPYKVW